MSTLNSIFLSFTAQDDEDGKGLKFEKNWPALLFY